MKVTVQPILSLRNLVEGSDCVEVPSAKTLAEVFQHLASQHPGFHERICTTDGRLRESVLIFVNDRQVHKENMYQTQLMDGARIMVVPSIAGG